MPLDAHALFSRPQTPAAEAWRDPLALLLASTGEGIYGVDLDGLCVFINQAGARMIGFEPDELLGRNMHDLTHHARADGSPYPEAQCPIFNAFRQGLPCRIDSEVFWRRDGSAFPVEYSSHPILDGAQVRGAVVTFVDITERKRAADALQRAKDGLEERVNERTRALATALKQVRELAARSETVREDERTRIAREVHDELGQVLTVLKLETAMCELVCSGQMPELDKHLQNMKRLIAQLFQLVRDVATALRPPILDAGIASAIEWQVRRFEARTQIPCMVEVPENLPKLSDAKAIGLFRILQEALTNIMRHAGAHSVQVSLRLEDGELCLCVSDDGKGFAPEQRKPGQSFGLVGMQERVLMLGGQLQIDSQPGEGTTLCARVAVAEEEVA